MCDWFVDNKLSICFREDKTKSILSSNTNQKKKIGTLEINNGNINIKQYSVRKSYGFEGHSQNQ